MPMPGQNINSKHLMEKYKVAITIKHAIYSQHHLKKKNTAVKTTN
jgi:hypothetical protein